MIKTFEDFNNTFLNESVKQFRKISDYIEKYKEYNRQIEDLIKECEIDNIEFVKLHGGKVEFKKPIELKFHYGYPQDVEKINISSLEISSDEEYEKEMFMDYELTNYVISEKNKYGEFLVAITDNEDRIIVDSTVSCYYETIFEIKKILEKL